MPTPPDAWVVPVGDVHGRVAATLPLAGYVLLFLRNPLTLLALGVIVSLAFVWPSVSRRRGHQTA
ncbi:hypothetical protein BH23ACT9_BH23ACT9_28170 [soil metagenome]